MIRRSRRIYIWAKSRLVRSLKRKHRVIAITDYTSLEVSTPHLDDVIRFADDTNRPSGKLKEHESLN